jgi:hypothetical protein
VATPYDTGQGLAFQIWAAYSAIVRSLENPPEPAMFRIAFDALHLGVENRIRIDRDSGARPEPLRKLHFRVAFGLANSVAEGAVVSQRLQFRELRQVGDPPVADRLGNNVGQRRV